MEKVHIIGAGGLAKDIIACFKQEVNFVGLWDDNLEKNSIFYNIPVLGKVDEIVLSSFKNDSFIIAIGNPIIREKIFDKLFSQKIHFATLVHSTAQIFDRENCIINMGSILMPFVYITTNVNIGKNCLIHISVGIHHDATIKEHCVLMPGSKITCGATLEKGYKLNANTAITTPLT